MSVRIQTAQVDVTPEAAGYRQEVLDRIDGLLTGLIDDNKLQCASYLFARDGQVFASKAMGALQHTADSPDYAPDSIRRIASVTKWFTLVCIMRLVEEGKLALVQQVKDWIPEFDKPAFAKITIHQLLTHTAGLKPDGGYFTEPYPTGWYDVLFAFEDGDGGNTALTDAEKLARSKSAWIKAILSGPPVCEPGTEWNYSSAGFSLLGEIIERVSGMRYDEYIRTTVIEPLGMTRTFFDVPEHLADEVCTTNDWDVRGVKRRIADNPASPPRTGGGLYSTLQDLSRLGHMMLTGSYNGKRILSRKSIELITRNQFPQGIPAFNWGGDIKKFPFGLSTSLSFPVDFFAPTAYMHEGAGRCALIVDPVERFVVVFFVPSIVDWVPESMLNLKNMIWSGLQ
ncbi:CubicO group peptidase (beta-lactamase class C family) [Paenibacillus cellulosilyticus]|uniref:CubicO group peptidase (Beta-lactamase class C family) n=1 Tax=Paenibacillus cellulosilyticus TaxID=375489 RepID=A0A2V2YE32_9BACL|nr:serine hydrolase domain-containing protein [Paenibacillus cellulosilyticus]PWV90537.1 CubicO group peptidase (beta-lactamase class C family) [Paenibacillus cellulosilyticus]QKS47080.1 beta-lactamase family protein [Paenibacillus cellulosilyticus]